MQQSQIAVPRGGQCVGGMQRTFAVCLNVTHALNAIWVLLLQEIWFRCCCCWRLIFRLIKSMRHTLSVDQFKFWNVTELYIIWL